MQKLLKKLTLFVLLFPFAYLTMHAGVRAVYLSSRHYEDDTIFVWGDSQTYRGLNIDRLSELTGRPVLSWARHGCGVYDLMAFKDFPPAGSNVVLGVGFPMMVRQTHRDFNRSGLSIEGLAAITFSGPYTWTDIWNTLRKRNYNPFRNVVYPRSPSGYEVFDKPRLNRKQVEKIDIESIELSPKFLSKVPLFERAIRALEKKGCRVLVIPFPNAVPDVQRRWELLYEHLASSNSGLVHLAPHPEFSKEINPMFDLTHVNKHGREEITRYTAQLINENGKADN